MEQLRSYAKYALLLLGVCGLSLVKGQDPVFSQFMLNKTYLNPAYVGQKGNLMATFMQREQWNNVPESNFSTTSANIEIGCPNNNIGIGLRVFRDVEGAGKLTHTAGALNISYHILGRFSNRFPWKKLRNNKTVLSFGMQIGTGQKTVDWSAFTFSDQYDPYIGLISPVSQVGPRRDISSGMIDLGFGMVFRTQLGKDGSYFSLGSALFHLNQPKESFVYGTNRLPRRFTFHGFWYYRLPERVLSKKYRYFSLGYVTDQHWKLDSYFSNLAVTNTLHGAFILNHHAIGLSFRTENFPLVSQLWDSFILSYQVNLPGNITLGAAADLNISSLQLRKSGTTMEFGLVWSIDGVYLCKPKRRRGQSWCFDQFGKGWLNAKRSDLILFMP